MVIKKRDKSEFKADSLYNGICAINRYFIEKFKEIGPFNLYGDFEFAPFRDILHSRMRELEEIYNGTYQGADPLSDNEMEQIFGHHELDRDTPRIFLRVFYG